MKNLLFVQLVARVATGEVDLQNWCQLIFMISNNQVTSMPVKKGAYETADWELFGGIVKIIESYFKDHKNTIESFGTKIIDLLKSRGILCSFAKSSDNAGSLTAELTLADFSKLIAGLV